MSNWFNVDRNGLAALLERRGKEFVLFELVQNAWDSGASAVQVTLEPIAGSPLATLAVEDNSPHGWTCLDHAFTMFAPSARATDAEKRGRFNLGEKLVLAIAREARIETMEGTLVFNEKGRRRSAERRTCGTRFAAVVRMTRDDLTEAVDAARQLIPPVPTSLNGEAIEVPTRIGEFTAKLPTEYADADGVMRRTMRQAKVEVYEGQQGGILEMGVPVCDAGWPWRLNVMQKVPLNMERDSVTDAFRKALQVAAVNAMADTISDEDASQPWVQESIGDGRASGEAVGKVLRKQFGDRAVVAVPGDPVANARAEAAGYTVIHGGSLSGSVWANTKKHGLVQTTSAVFPTPKPAAVAAMNEASEGVCPLCGK